MPLAAHDSRRGAHAMRHRGSGHRFAMVHTWLVSETAPTQLPRWARDIAAPVLAMVAAMWLLEILDVVLRGRLDGLGIASRSWEGLLGIPAAPLLHSGFAHLIANTVPFLVLGSLVAWRSDGRIWPVTITIALVGGLGVWLLGPVDTVTIGASGLVFGFLAYLLTLGVLSRRWLDILIALTVFLIYGGLLWGALPFGVPAGVSWLAHITGAAAGVLAAFLFRTPRRPPDPGS